MVHAIIGSGLSGSLRLYLEPEAILYEKSRQVGGRTVTKSLGNGYYCDIGATYFKDSLDCKKDGNSFQYSILNFLNSLDLKIESYSYHPDSNLYFAIKGNQNISQQLVQNRKFQLNKELIDFIAIPKHRFQLNFIDGSNAYVDRLTISAPLPQALSFFPSSYEKDEWTKFVAPYMKYRKTLVMGCYWSSVSENFLNKIKNLPSKSFLNKEKVTEYISLESNKSIGSGFVLMAQYSNSFSNQNFDNWRNADRSPTDFCLKCFENSFQEFLQKHHLTEDWIPHEPDNCIVHKWKYAQAENPMLGNEGILNLDSNNYKEYTELVNKTNIRLTGDWLYGSRIERILGGEILWKNLDQSQNGVY
jgi:predicted NAD/FAD-dependent oxidoreductase